MIEYLHMFNPFSAFSKRLFLLILGVVTLFGFFNAPQKAHAAATIVVSSPVVAADGKTITATLSGGTGTGYGITNKTGLSIRKTDSGGVYYNIASVSVSTTTLTINGGFPFAAGDTVLVDIGATNTIFDSGANNGQTLTGIATTNNSTKTVTAYSSTNSAFKKYGVTTSNLYQSHSYITSYSFSTRWNFDFTGTDIAVGAYTGTSISTEVDGTTTSATGFLTNTWQVLPLKTGLTDTLHSAGIVPAAGNSIDLGTGAVTTGFILVAGSSPAVSAPASRNWGTQYWFGESPWTTYGVADGSPASITYNGSKISYGMQGGKGYRFATDSSFINIWTIPSITYKVYQDGSLIATTAVGSSSYVYILAPLVSGLDTTAVHEYEVVASSPLNSEVIYSTMFELGNNGLAAVSHTAKTIETFYGDSITVQTGITDATQGDAFLMGRAIGNTTSVKGASNQRASTYGRDNTSGLLTNSNRVWERWGHNDATAAVTMGAVGTPATFKGDFYTMLTNIRSRIGSSKWIFVEGIFPTTASNRTTYNTAKSDVTAAFITATSDAYVKYINTDNWIDPTVGVDTADGTHPNASGYAKIGNREIPFAATSGFTVSGPASGTAGSASTNFTVTLAGGATFTGDVSVTISDGGNGGTITPSVGSAGTSSVTVTPTNGATNFTFTYNAASAGVKTLTYTNSPGWFNPGTSSFTAAASGDITAPTITNVSSDKTNGTYTVGEVIDIDVTFSEAVTSTGNVTVTLETGATDRTCTFTVSSSTTGTCNYTVQSGDTSSDLTVNSISGTIADASSNAMTDFAPATNLAANKVLVIDTTAPSISSLSPTDNAAGVSANADLVLSFDEAVNVGTGNITIKKTSDNSTIEIIDVTSGLVTGTGTSTITVNPSITLLSSIEYYVVVDATAFDDVTGNSYSGISSTTAWSFTTADITAPTITNISSDKTNGTYTVGEVIDIDVTFSEVVTSTGSVTVTLETGATDRTCTFTVTGSTTGTCNYTVQSGDTTSDLTVKTITGTIADASSNAMTNFAPATNLAANKAIVIDTTTATPTLSTPTSSSSHINSSPISVSFSVPETPSTGSIQLVFTPSVGSSITIHLHDVAAATPTTFALPLTGGISGVVEVSSTSAEIIPAGTYSVSLSYQDALGNTAASATATGVVITQADITAPTITNVSSDKANGTYTVGEVIDIDVTFSESVISTGNVTVTLETGATDRTCTFTVASSTTGTCNYTVQAGDISSDLTVNSISGTIADASSNAMTNFAPTTNLAANKALVIDTTAPTASSLSPADNAIGVSINANPTIVFTESVVVGSGNITIKKTSDNSTIETINVTSGQVTGSGTNTIIVNPTSSFDGLTEYYVLIDATAFRDAVGNTYAGISSTTAWSFTSADTGVPTITNVTSTKPNGSYKAGEVIGINVTFSEIVNSTGLVTVTLETGVTDRTCTFTVSASSSASCDYTVQAGDASSDLTVNSITGTIADEASNAMTDFDPEINLAANKNIIIDTTAPVVNSLLPLDNAVNVPVVTDFTIVFNEPVVVGSGNIVIKKTSDDSTIETIDITSGQVTGSGTDTITVSPSNPSLDLTEYYVLIDAAAFEDAVGNTYAGISSATAWSFTTADTTAPTISSVSSSVLDGTYTTDDVIDVDVTFSESINSTGNITVTLETGTTDRTCTFTVISSTTGSCNYIVQAGDTTSDLTVKTISGTIADEFGNIMTDFVPVTNLASNKAIVIDTATTPVVVEPTVTTSAASSVSVTTVTLGGNITATGGANPTTRGVEYGADTSYGTQSTSSGSFSTGTFTQSITGLTCNTTYHFRAFATNSAGTSTGSDATFTTSACPDVTVIVSSVISASGKGSSWVPPTKSFVDADTCPATQTLTQNLKSGSRNGVYSSYTKAKVTEVKILQAHLNRLGFAAGPVDGILGPKSDKAIKRLQVFLGTKPDGYIGAITRKLLNNSCKK